MGYIQLYISIFIVLFNDLQLNNLVCIIILCVYLLDKDSYKIFSLTVK